MNGPIPRRVDTWSAGFQPKTSRRPARCEAHPDRLERLDREPALEGPLAQGDAVPRDERGIEAQRIVHAEIRELRPDARFVDDAVAEVAPGQRDVGLERGLDELRVGVGPTDAREHADVSALDESEAPRPAGDLRELPREQVAPVLAVELRRLGEQQRLAGQVDTVPENVGRDAHVRPTLEEAVDLLAARAERHGAVEDRDPTGMHAVDLAGEREHRLAAERHEHAPRCHGAQLHGADPLERELALEHLHLDPGKRLLDERQRVERAEQPQVAVLARQQQTRPRSPPLLVVGPLHFVEHQHVARGRRHLDRAADDRRAGIDALLARDEAHLLLAELVGQPTVRFLREHPQRPRVHAPPVLGQEAERLVRLAGVRRAEVRDHGLRLHAPRRQPDLDPPLRLLHRRVAVRALGARVPGRPARALRRSAAAASGGHRRTVPARARAGSAREGSRP